MRRGLAVLMTMLFLLTAGCKSESSPVQAAVEFRAALVQAGGCSFRAEVTADFTDSVVSFTLDCQGEADGTTYLTVTAPETIAGITATVTDSGGTVTYDGMAMDFGLLANGNVIPAAAPAIALCCWTGEYIAYAGQEEAGYRASYEKNFDEKRLNVDTWFENGVPIYAEVCYNGTRILKMTISDFTMN